MRPASGAKAVARQALAQASFGDVTEDHCEAVCMYVMTSETPLEPYLMPVRMQQRYVVNTSIRHLPRPEGGNVLLHGVGEEV